MISLIKSLIDDINQTIKSVFLNFCIIVYFLFKNALDIVIEIFKFFK